MPGRDGTGPVGNGPMTGRGAGFCVAGNVNRSNYSGKCLGLGFGFGYGLGCGRGRGGRFGATGAYGWRRWLGVNPALVEDKELLKRRADMLQAELDEIRKNLG